MSEAEVLRIPIKEGMVARVLDALEARNRSPEQLRAVYERRGIAENIAFVDEIEQTLFIYRRGRNLQKAAVDFLKADEQIEREFVSVLTEATYVERARTLSVAAHWPPIIQETPHNGSAPGDL